MPGILAEPHDVATSHKRQRRMTTILDALAERGTVSFAELADSLGVSAATVRRDLTDLAAQRLLERTHGGAHLLPSRAELPISLRDMRMPHAKKAIAAAADLIPTGRYAVALGGGSTTAGVARELAARHDGLTILTNSLTIAQVASGHPLIRVVMTGGVIRSESLELVGVLAEKTFEAITVDLAVLGADGISAEGGVTTFDETEARTNRAMIGHARGTLVVADGSKVGRVTSAIVATIGQVSVLVTDASAASAALDAIHEAGVTVVVAGSAR